MRPSGAAVDGAWRLEAASGLALLTCLPIDGVPGIAHVFSTRRADGGGDFDLGPSLAPDALFVRRRARLLRAAGFAADSPTTLEQVHGARVVRAFAAGTPERADAVVWLEGDPPAALGVRTADCVPILLVERAGRATAAVHAGWRGTAADIAARSVAWLVGAGIRADDLIAALGPAIGPCCYEVGEEVAAAVAAASGAAPELPSGGRPRVDLHEANARQLRAAGIPPEAIHRAPWCTSCRADLFFSFRRDGKAAGRMMACIGARGSGLRPDS